MGEKGGGQSLIQVDEIIRIAEFLNSPINYNQAKKICSTLFGGTNSFREGRIGSWKTQLTAEHINALKETKGFNELLIALNYEKNTEW